MTQRDIYWIKYLLLNYILASSQLIVELLTIQYVEREKVLEARWGTYWLYYKHIEILFLILCFSV